MQLVSYGSLVIRLISDQITFQRRSPYLGKAIFLNPEILAFNMCRKILRFLKSGEQHIRKAHSRVRLVDM
jgi:hypothetical protein